ncbi:MAG: DoxX family protein [Blastochloris sp.]|nr:DoxX family protein [Blastochloris sp.]
MTRTRSRQVLGSLFILAGLNHFWQPRFYTAIMPEYLPAHAALVAASGYAEIGLGALTFVPGADYLSRWSLIALLIAVFPANLHMAMHPERYRRIPPLLLWLRLPLHAVLIGWVWWATAPELAFAHAPD